jgi:restriction system protein
VLFDCASCGRIGFDEVCPECGPARHDVNVPLDPAYYPEFRYRSQGVVKDLLVKRRTERELDAKLEAVLAKYEQFRDPYFVNYMHLAGQGSPDGDQLHLFGLVLVRLGFDELLDNPGLTSQLVLSTSFQFQYESFVLRTSGHLRADLDATLVSWIDERGPAFRQDLPLLLYWLWESQSLPGEVAYRDRVPLGDPAEYLRIENLCESIYLDLRVTRLKTTLEQFDPDRFVTIYRVDAMSGYEFEDFLGLLFTTLGYDIETTKRTGDQGADLFARRFGKRMVIQAKNYFDRVGNSAVQQVLAAKTFFACDEAMVVSNSSFTVSAQDLASAAGVRLVDRRALQGYLDDYNQAIMDQAAREHPEAEVAQVQLD